MTEPVTTEAAVVGAVKTVLDMLGRLKDRFEARDEQAYLNDVLLAENKVWELQQKALALANENDELRAKLSLLDDMHYDRQTGTYWSKSKNAEQTTPNDYDLHDGPYCPRCFEAQRKAIHMTYGEYRLVETGRTPCFRCTVCSHTASGVAPDYRVRIHADLL